MERGNKRVDEGGGKHASSQNGLPARFRLFPSCSGDCPPPQIPALATPLDWLQPTPVILQLGIMRRSASYMDLDDAGDASCNRSRVSDEDMVRGIASLRKFKGLSC